jgi:hypothetical protein
MDAETAVWLVVGAVMCIAFLIMALNAFRK